VAHLRFAVLITTSATFVLLMLIADGPHLGKQLMLAAATGLFLVMIVRKGNIPAVQVVVVMLIATTGELVLSLGWGLYDYRFAEVPFYVPPGHGVFYVLACESARQQFLRRHAVAITRLVLVAGSLYALVSLIIASDVWGLLWWIGAALLVTRSRSPLLLSTCIVYTVLLEWLGTAIGNWRWEGVVPFLGLTSANPPSGVGILYCLLDLFTVMICSAAWFGRLQARSTAPVRVSRVDDFSLIVDGSHSMPVPLVEQKTRFGG